MLSGNFLQENPVTSVSDWTLVNGGMDKLDLLLQLINTSLGYSVAVWFPLPDHSIRLIVWGSTVPKAVRVKENLRFVWCSPLSVYHSWWWSLNGLLFLITASNIECHVQSHHLIGPTAWIATKAREHLSIFRMQVAMHSTWLLRSLLWLMRKLIVIGWIVLNSRRAKN